MNERKRCNPWGICAYQLCPKTGRVIFQTNGSLFITHCGNQTSGFRQIEPSGVTRANPILSPTNPDLIAYFGSGNICVHNCVTNVDYKLTNLTDSDCKFKEFSIDKVSSSVITVVEFLCVSGEIQ